MKTIAKATLPIPPWLKSSPDLHNPYLGAEETAILVALVASVQPRMMFEFGVQSGRTAKTLLDRIPTLQRYVGIDVPHTHMPTLPSQRSEVPAEPGLYAAADERFYVLIHPRGSQAWTADELGPCDAVFIDGDHSIDAVLHDSNLARAIVRNGGIIIWHDYGNASVQVTEALDQLCCEGWPIKHVENTWLAYCRQ
jgi:predicted O-methyltransferase YrrM